MRAIIILVMILTFIAPVAYAANPEVVNLIGKIQSTYEGTRSFEANFEQTLRHKESGATENRKGKLQFSKPLNIRWQTQAPHEETLVVTNKGVWDYLPDEEVAYRYPASVINDSANIVKVLTGQAALNRDFDVKADGRDKGLRRLLLYPNEPSPQLVEARIWVDPDTGFIKRAVITDFYGNENEVAFTRFTPNASLSSSTFNFTPPKNVDVEDRSGPGERELFK